MIKKISRKKLSRQKNFDQKISRQKISIKTVDLAKQMMRVSFNFIVCRALHESRTFPLWQTTCAMIARDYPDSTVTLLGGFDAFDHIPITRASATDDYQSCHDKLYSIFDRNNGSEADWFIIADDDTWWNLPNLFALLPHLPHDRPLICGLIGPARIPGSPSIPHAHGGAGILISAPAFAALSRFAPRPRHSRHSDVTLALLVQAHNLTPARPIEWGLVYDMHGPDKPLPEIDPRAAISIHVKDRASFASLYSRAGHVMP